VTVARAGGSVLPASTGGALELDEGSYTVFARAPGFMEHSEHVQVAAGQTVSVSFALAQEKRKPTATALGMEGWDATAWTAEGQAFVRRGGGSVLYKSSGSPGVYSFTVTLAAGGGVFRGKSLEWVMDYHDDRNYVLFHLDKNDFRRIQLINGKRTELVKKPHGLSMVDSLSATVQVEVAPGSIVNRVRNGDQWVVLDSWSAPERNFIQGRFGIVINGKDEVHLSNFSFTPKE
jgi:hypothetical protein